MEDIWEDVAFGPSISSDTSSLIRSLIQAESSGNPNAISPKGARGLMQVMPETGAEVAQKLGMTNYDLMNPEDNQKIGTAYFNQMLDQFGSPELASAAYNAGPGRVQRTIDRLGTNDPNLVLAQLPEETRNYVPKVMSGASQYGAQAQPTPTPEEDVWEDVPMPIAEDVWEDVPTEAPQTGYSINDAAAEVLDYLPFGKKLAAGMSYLGSGMQEGQYDYAKQKLDENAQRFRDNAGKGAKLGAFATGAIAQAPIAVGNSLISALATGAGLGAGDALDDATFGKDAIAKGTTGAGLGALFGGGAYGLAKGVGGAYKYLSDDLSPEVKSLAKRLTGYGDDELTSATTKLAEAQADNSPTFLTEAIDKPEFTAQAKAITRKDNTADIARNALQERQLGQYDRISDIADVVSPVRSSDEATSMVVGKAKAVQEGLKKAREEATTPLYSQAYKENPTLDSQEVADLLNIPRVQKSVKKVQLDAPDMPANSTQLMDEVLADLKETAGGLKATGAPRASRRVMGTASKLEGELEKILPLKQARETFAEMSVPINKLKKAGFDKILKDEYGETVAKEGFTASQLGQQLLSERTKIADVRKLKEAFGGDDEPIKAAVRSHIQDLFDRKIDGYDVSNVLNTPKFKKKLNVLVGEKDASRLLSRLEREIKISQTNKALRVGSDTAPNIEGSIGEDIKRMGKIAASLKYPTRMAGDAVDYIGNAISRKSPKVYQDEARIIFSRDPAQQALNDILGRRASNANVDANLQELLPLIEALSRGSSSGLFSEDK